jgi:hypothetical protein
MGKPLFFLDFAHFCGSILLLKLAKIDCFM